MSGFYSKNVRELGSQVPDFLHVWCEYYILYSYPTFLSVQNFESCDEDSFRVHIPHGLNYIFLRNCISLFNSEHKYCQSTKQLEKMQLDYSALSKKSTSAFFYLKYPFFSDLHLITQPDIRLWKVNSSN